ncbi:MAG: DUF3078 domain-containing protein [Bacteroidales bacterium]
MKKTITTLLILTFALRIMAQDQKIDSTLGWFFPAVINFSVSQVSFSNWSAGGEPSYSINGLVISSANYKSKMATWDNNLILAYGLMKQGIKEIRKTDDNIEFSSKFGYKAINNWYYSGLVQFKSQFSDGYKYDDAADTKTLLSTFMAPAYLNLALGMNYSPSKVFNLFIGPISGKSTFVMDDTLSNAGAFGVEKGKNVRNEFGGNIKAVLNKDIMKNVNLLSKLELFSNYIDNPQNIDIDWQLLINMKVNKWLSASINLHEIYDDDVKTIENNQTQGPKLQFKEVFGIGLNLKF